MHFVAVNNQDKILIRVMYRPNADREVMNLRIDSAKKVIAIIAEANHWSRWLKVQEDVRMMQPILTK